MPCMASMPCMTYMPCMTSMPFVTSFFVSFLFFSFLEKNDRFWKRTFRFELSKNEKQSCFKNKTNNLNVFWHRLFRQKNVFSFQKRSFLKRYLKKRLFSKTIVTFFVFSSLFSNWKNCFPKKVEKIHPYLYVLYVLMTSIHCMTSISFITYMPFMTSMTFMSFITFMTFITLWSL